ncbi:MAG: LuxR C-terminal-related transcriptional regulator [Phycisphaerales bacterium JB060]
MPPRAAPAFLVCRPNAEHPAFQGIAGRLRSVELALEAAGIASGCGPRGVVVTVQMGGLLECHRSGNDFGRCTLLGQLLPWVHAIVRAALDGREGDAPRSWLTAREMIVLEKLIDGGSVAEIAQQLGRSRYTVHDQVKSLHRKLGVRTRAALVCCATRGVDPPTVGNPSSVVS